jgi:Tol biopolymer transport system component
MSRTGGRLAARGDGRGIARASLVGLGVVFVLLAAAVPRAHAAFPGVNGNLAFATDRDGNYEVYSSDAAGVSQVNLTQNASTDLFPVWSPDGAKIAFSSFRSGGDEEIYTANADGSNPARLTNSPGMDAEPAWSADGTKIAFRSDRDGNFEIYTMDADGSNQVNITNDSSNNDRPAWSPGGSKIAFESDRDGNFEIYTMDTDGSNQVDVSNNAASDRRPGWSPTGQKIAFDSSRDGNLEIYSMAAGGTAQTRLTSNTKDDSEAAWSPDGTKIAFRSQRDGNAEIYVMGQDGTAQTRVTNNTFWDSAPDWRAAPTGYPRPKGATPLRVSLVPTFQPCASGNRVHGAPLAFDSCNPPVQVSPNLTVGSTDSNGAAANFIGFLRLSVHAGVPGPPDDSDVDINASLSDIRCNASGVRCGGGPLSDYTGELVANLQLRITDNFNGSSSAGGTDVATVSDTALPVTIPCNPTSSTTTGSICAVTTTANTIVPGMIKDTKRMTVRLGQVEVDDGGADGTAATTVDNSPFAVQGVFVP